VNLSADIGTSATRLCQVAASVPDECHGGTSGTAWAGPIVHRPADRRLRADERPGSSRAGTPAGREIGSGIISGLAVA
jgi:hypothetical protein